MAQLELLSGLRQKGESSKALQACNDWLRLGPGRTLPLLLRKYGKTQRITAPTGSLDTLQDWSAKFGWEERGKAFDALAEEETNAARQRIINRGFARDYRRIAELDKLARFLIEQLYEKGENDTYHNVWMPDVKAVGTGQYAERVDVERFNPAIFEQLRGTFDDIAKELGQRKGDKGALVQGENVKVYVGVDLNQV